METTGNLVADANDNLQTAFVRLADYNPLGESQQFGGLTAVFSGVPIPLFNRIFVFDIPPYDDLAAAVAWMTEKEMPFWVTVSDPIIDAVDDLTGDLDLMRLDNPEPGMTLDSLDEIPPNESIADIDVVTDPDELHDWITVAAPVFEIPQDTAEQITPDSILTDDQIRMFVGRVDGQPVACGQLVQTGDVAGVYTIGVVEELRREGIGEAMTWEVLRAGRERGCNVGVLQSSEMGYPLYDRMGFETVVTYCHFEPTT